MRLTAGAQPCLICHPVASVAVRSGDGDQHRAAAAAPAPNLRELANGARTVHAPVRALQSLSILQYHPCRRRVPSSSGPPRCRR
jgi:hypothetical protein